MRANRCRANLLRNRIMSDFDNIGEALVKSLFESLDFDITEYCNAAVDAAKEYCIQEFKKACKKAGITWKKSWENILYE